MSLASPSPMAGVAGGWPAGGLAAGFPSWRLVGLPLALYVARRHGRRRVAGAEDVAVEAPVSSVTPSGEKGEPGVAGVIPGGSVAASSG